MSKIYDYEEYQNQRVKVTYTDKKNTEKKTLLVYMDKLLRLQVDQ